MNVALLLDMVADGIGDRVAVGSRDDGIRYDTLRTFAAAAKARVQEKGATTVAVVEPNGPLVPVALFAAAWTGCSYAPLNYRLPETAIKELLARLQPAVTASARSVGSRKTIRRTVELSTPRIRIGPPWCSIRAAPLRHRRGRCWAISI